MPPKKAKKISLNEFLGGDGGSWADEMDSLPNAPAARTDDDGRPQDRYGRRDDFLSSRPDRVAGPPRDDVPIPTQPPYTAFIGNLAFDISEVELEGFFGSSHKTKSIKIIKDREDKPKGFGYIEFDDVEGLKDALSKSGSSVSGRTIRVSVAEPPKERSGFGGGFEDDSKFESPWRRDGPLPDQHGPGDSSRRRYDTGGSNASDRAGLPSLSEEVNDWRSARPARTEPEPPIRRKGSGFSTPEGPSAADRDESWTIGSKFKPSGAGAEDGPGGRFGSRGKSDMGPPRDSPADEGDWRTSARPRPTTRNSTSPSSSTPPTPQMGRKKLELLPRVGGASASPSPLSSPKMGPSPSVSGSRSNPFGAARPVDVTSREKEVTERLEKDREVTKERLSMSRTSSRTATERTPLNRTRTPPPTGASVAKVEAARPPAAAVAVVRPSLSFASAAAKKDAAGAVAGEVQKEPSSDADVEKVTAVAENIKL
ncbi:hypothetical protein BD779DRAFT_1496180 [Infundibulicybe gibba]|nr:hypothetical protein BD779DRAFT_1496180 [Infundibulicybe gibba]